MNNFIVLILLCTTLGLIGTVNAEDKPELNRHSNTKGIAWITSPETNVLFQSSKFRFVSKMKENLDPEIKIDPTQTYQPLMVLGIASQAGVLSYCIRWTLRAGKRF